MSYVRAPDDLKLAPLSMGTAEMTFTVYDYGHCKSKEGQILFKHSRTIQEIPRGDGYDLSVDVNLNTKFYGFEAKDLERVSKWAHRAALWIKYKERKEK